MVCMRAVGLLEEGGERDGDPVVHALAEHFALALAHANDGVGRAVDANLLAQRIAGAKQVVDDVGADDGDVGAVRVFDLGEGAAQFDIEVGKRRHGPGPAANIGVGAWSLLP